MMSLVWKCGTPTCACHTDPAHKVSKPFPGVGANYCCARCAEIDVVASLPGLTSTGAVLVQVRDS